MKNLLVYRWLWITALIISCTVALVAPGRPASAAGCQDTGENCVLGGVGPKGGIIFYDAGSMQWWGRYLEAESSVPRIPNLKWGPPESIYGTDPNRAALQRRSMGIGMGKWNTIQMRKAGLSIADLFLDGDWYLPSKDELDALYRFKIPFKGPAWTSSESEDTFAWYQLFKDGTQFTDANGILPKLKSNKHYTTSAVHVGSGFAAEPMRIIRIRAFPPTTSEPPPAQLLTSVRANTECSTSALTCKIGDIGPGGGVVVYDAGRNQPWGRYLEIAPKECEASGLSFVLGHVADLGPGNVAYTTRIGSGRMNTEFLWGRRTSTYSAAAYAKRTCNGFSDWFLPSKDELNEAFRVLSHSRKGVNLTPLGQFARGYYWTSSNYNGSTAWTQYFADGQQFDRVQTLSRNKKPPMNPFYVRPMRAFKEGMPYSSFQTNFSFSAKSKVTSGKRFVEISGTTSQYSPGEEIDIEVYWGSKIVRGFTAVRDDGTFGLLLPVNSDRQTYIVLIEMAYDIDLRTFFQ